MIFLQKYQVFFIDNIDNPQIISSFQCFLRISNFQNYQRFFLINLIIYQHYQTLKLDNVDNYQFYQEKNLIMLIISSLSRNKFDNVDNYQYYQEKS